MFLRALSRRRTDARASQQARAGAAHAREGPEAAGALAGTLHEVDRRRAQLWTTSVFVVASVTLIVVLFWLAGDFLPAPLRFDDLPRGSVLVLLAGLGCAFVLYVVEKEASLRRLAAALVEERVRSERLSARLAETASIAEVAKALNATLEVADVFRLILASALDLLGGQEASIMLLDATRDHLDVVSYRGPRGEVVMRQQVAMGHGIAGRVALEQKPLLLHADDAAPASDLAPGAYHSTMCAPLSRRGELIGVLELTETRGERAFTEEDLSVLQVFAEHSAIAIGNARLFEQEREQIQRLEELDRLKSDFVATVSHELKTPLTAIIGAAKTASRNTTIDPEKRALFLDMIHRQGSRLLRLVDDILTTARIESGGPRLRRERIALRELAEVVVADIAHTRYGEGREITLETVPERPEVWGDLTALQQILSNLVENACKYSPESEPVSVRIVEKPGEALIDVVDRGRGIPPEQLESIFDRFRQADSSATRNVGGVGLGLYIVKNLVREHHGTIEVESELGRGSVFRVRLPQRARGSEVGVAAAAQV